MTVQAPEVPPPSPDEPSGDEPDLGFVRFVMRAHEEDCPPQASGDCDSSIEILADGSIQLDAWGAPDQAALEGTAARAELSALARLITVPAFLARLDASPVCAEANATETMQVWIAGREHGGNTGYCNEAEIQAVRGALIATTARHFPESSLVSPPF